MCSSQSGPLSSVCINYTECHSFSSLYLWWLMTHDMTNTRNWSPINSSVWSLVITRHLRSGWVLIGHLGHYLASDWLMLPHVMLSCPQPRLPITRCHNAHISRHPVTIRHSPHILTSLITLTWLFISDIAARNRTLQVSYSGTWLLLKCLLYVDCVGGQMLFLAAYNKQLWDNGTVQCSNTPW